MNFKLNWSICIDILLAIQYEQPWLKQQRSTLTSKISLDLWHLLLGIVSLRQTYQVSITTLTSKVFKKIYFSKLIPPHLND